ncbi:DUF2510 domain-containing protein [Nocardioides sp. Bht2]|uniref:DUF2510 domain-containing protein n=1 Tax=Nocardioides sp. Bht2 TaxID=3392297 RepID=UPI0039B681F5
MSSDQKPALGPGWYSAPDLPGALRYWDGEEWTEEYEVKKDDPEPVTSWVIAKGILLGAVLIAFAVWVLAVLWEIAS